MKSRKLNTENLGSLFPLRNNLFSFTKNFWIKTILNLLGSHNEKK